MRKGRVLTALLSITFILAAAGCGDSARLRSEITGTWTRTVLSEGGVFEGSLAFAPDGSLKFSFSGDVKGYERSEGRYRLSGRDIIFEDNSCRGAGTYRFRLKEGSLSFIPLNDGCLRRKTLLTGEWSRPVG